MEINEFSSEDQSFDSDFLHHLFYQQQQVAALLVVRGRSQYVLSYVLLKVSFSEYENRTQDLNQKS